MLQNLIVRTSNYSMGATETKSFSTPISPQANGLVKVVNKTIKHGLKTRFGEHKGSWVDKLLEVLWAYWTSKHSST